MPSFDPQELYRWLAVVKQRIEDLSPGNITLSASQITSGVFDPARIPDLPFTRIQLTGRRLLGRTSDGLGDAEEIQVAGGLTLAAGLLTLTTVPPTAPRVTGLPMPLPIVDDGTDEARWALAAVPRAVTGATGATGASGMDGRDAESGDDPWAYAAAGTRPVVTGATGATGANGMDGADGVDGGYWPATSSGIQTATGITGSGTAGNLAKWSTASILTDGPAESNVPLLNAANVFTVSGSNTFGSGGSGATNATVDVNGSSANARGPAVSFSRNSVVQGYVATESTLLANNSNSLALYGSTADGVSVYAAHASGDARIYSRNALAATFGVSQSLALTGLVTATAAGTHTIGPGGTSATNIAITINGSSASGRGALLAFQRNSVDQGYVSTESNLLGNASNAIALYGAVADGTSVYAAHASGALRFYSGGTTQRWAVNAAGDWTFGASSHIADSNGTPTISSGFGAGPSIAGNDYAFILTMGTTGPTSGVVSFGHTFSNAPVCVSAWGSGGAALDVVDLASTTTQITFNWVTPQAVGVKLQVLVRGY